MILNGKKSEILAEKYLLKKDYKIHFKNNLPSNASIIEFGSGSNKKIKKLLTRSFFIFNNFYYFFNWSIVFEPKRFFIFSKPS